VKMANDVKYQDITALQDIFWIRNEVSSIDDGIQLLHYIWKYVLGWKWTIKQKKFISSLPHIDWLEKIFIQQLETAIESDTHDWGWKTHENYQDIKITWDIWWHPVEIQIVLVDNKNESWYSHHWIFDCKKKIRCLARLQNYIGEPKINDYIQEALEKHPELNMLWGGNQEKARKNIFQHLLDDHALLPLRFPGKETKTYYSSIQQRNKYHSEKFPTLYPEWVKAFYEGKWINKHTKIEDEYPEE
jgi:hypothetical protein